MASPRFCPNCFAQGFSGYCGRCGYRAPSQPPNPMFLPPGVVLNGRYRIGRILGAGGFGVTYLAQDQQTKRRYAVKEYLPAALAVRENGSLRVRSYSQENEADFSYGMRVFAREVRVLRGFLGNPSIVQVYDYFEANGTAYFVMEFLDGVTLRALMQSMGGKVTPDLGLAMLRSMAGILEGVHAQGLLHRDVSPENIFMTQAGEIKLIDFGATRVFLGEKSQSLSVILKPGFAPPEQYSSRGQQGPWTDLYALCATFYYAVSGKMPPEAPDRLIGEAVPALGRMVPGLSQITLAAVEAGLSLDYRKRPQSMSEFLPMLRDAPKRPSNLDTTVPLEAPKKSLMPFVQAIHRGQPGDKWLLPKDQTLTIGRASGKCNIVFEAAQVSRVHCTLRYDEAEGVFMLVDQSTNGTLARNRRLSRGESVRLKAGERFCLVGPENTMKVGVE